MLRFYTCYKFCGNFLSTSKDKLTWAILKTAFTNDNSTFSHTFAISRLATPALALPLIFTKLVAKHTDINLQKAIKLALELFI